MTIPNELADGFRRFRVNGFPRQKMMYETLAERGQSPHTLIVGCCDSRVDPAAIFDASPGELFVVRNVANLVPPFERDGGLHGVSAALEFAVGTLKVSNILVLGHKQCGGVDACAGGHGPKDSLFLGPWLGPMRPALEEVRQALGEEVELSRLSDALGLHAIRHSIARLLDFPFVADAIAKGQLTLHGARFGVADGELEWLGDDGNFSVISP